MNRWRSRYVPGCITVFALISIPMCRWLNTPIPQVLTSEYLNGTSVNFIFVLDDGITTLSRSNDKRDQQITLQKDKLFDGQGHQRTTINVSRGNQTLLRKLAESLRSKIPNSTRFDGNYITVDLVAQDDAEMIKLTATMLETCLFELGIAYGQKFVWNYDGNMSNKRYKAYLDRNYPKKRSGTPNTNGIVN